MSKFEARSFLSEGDLRIFYTNDKKSEKQTVMTTVIKILGAMSISCRWNEKTYLFTKNSDNAYFLLGSTRDFWAHRTNTHVHHIHCTRHTTLRHTAHTHVAHTVHTPHASHTTQTCTPDITQNIQNIHRPHHNATHTETDRQRLTETDRQWQNTRCIVFTLKMRIKQAFSLLCIWDLYYEWQFCKLFHLLIHMHFWFL